MPGSHDLYPHDLERVEALFRAHGMEPRWRRVWFDGVDITDVVPPELWPWPYRRTAPKPAERGWRELRARIAGMLRESGLCR